MSDEFPSVGFVVALLVIAAIGGLLAGLLT